MESERSMISTFRISMFHWLVCMATYLALHGSMGHVASADDPKSSFEQKTKAQLFYTSASTTEIRSFDGPEPGDVYREYKAVTGPWPGWAIIDPKPGHKGKQQYLPNTEAFIEVGNLEEALRAEVLVDRWGGHVGTSRKKIRFKPERLVNASRAFPQRQLAIVRNAICRRTTRSSRFRSNT